MKADEFTEVNTDDYCLAAVAQGTMRTEGATAIGFTQLTCCVRTGSVDKFFFHHWFFPALVSVQLVLRKSC